MGIGFGDAVGIGCQILYVPAVQAIFEFSVRSLSVFSTLRGMEYYFLVGGSDGYHQSSGYIFAFQVLPYDYILFGSDLLIVLSGHYSESGLCHGG